MNIVKHIPTGILTCFAGKTECIEYSIMEISKKHVMIRMSEDREIHDLLFCAFLWEKQGYEKFGPFNTRCTKTIKKDFYVLKKYEIMDLAFEKMFDAVIAQYQKYVMLKLDSDDNYFSGELVDYPYEKDDEFCINYEEWKSKKERVSKISALVQEIEQCDVELSLSLETPWFIEDYLAGEFKSPFRKKANRLYIGNAYCHNLFPDMKLLKEILDYAYHDDIAITIVTTYLRESLLDKEKEKIAFLNKWCEANNIRIEIEINDYGYLELLKDYHYFDLNYGRLINKRRKDPRFIYKSGWDKQAKRLSENAVNDEAFEGFLENFGITRFEMEACGYNIKIIPNKTDLHLPFYQTNTAQYCPLYALCKNGDRARQELVTSCPGYCKSQNIMYPEHLNMIGRYNSLFALDTKGLQDYLDNGLDRIVWNYW